MSVPYVVAHNLSKSFHGTEVLEALSFSVEPGDVVGVLGKNGAGKTTLLELMLGFTPPSGGSIELFGHDSFRLPGAVKARVGFVPQQDELLNPLSVADQIGVIASFYPHWDHSLIEHLSRAWEVSSSQRIKAMSVGQRQKLSILLALGHHPDLLILDEPVASLDPVARRAFLEQIIDVASDSNRAVILSSHIVSDIERLANKIWILKDHQLYWHGDFDALKESIVRLHIRADRPLPHGLTIPQALSLQIDTTLGTAVVRHWNDDASEALSLQLDAEIEVEPLGLEDIFLELHR